jgi:hypothetical protein
MVANTDSNGRSRDRKEKFSLVPEGTLMLQIYCASVIEKQPLGRRTLTGMICGRITGWIGDNKQGYENVLIVILTTWKRSISIVSVSFF